eukprot:6113172-Karenia_brevis.AAC.1
MLGRIAGSILKPSHVVCLAGATYAIKPSYKDTSVKCMYRHEQQRSPWEASITSFQYPKHTATALIRNL